MGTPLSRWSLIRRLVQHGWVSCQQNRPHAVTRGVGKIGEQEAAGGAQRWKAKTNGTEALPGVGDGIVVIGSGDADMRAAAKKVEPSMASSTELRESTAAERIPRFAILRFMTGNLAGRVLLTAIACTTIGGVFGLPMAASMGWRNSEMQSLSQFWAWGLVIPLILLFDRWLPFSAKQLGRRAGAHFAASLVVTFLYLYLFFFLQALLGAAKWDDLDLAKMTGMGRLGWFVWSLLIYWAIAGGLQAYRYYQRYLGSELRLERMERSFSEARLNSLRMQLDPHFLFNALNTISSHVERDPKLTRRMIEHLGDLLRMSLESKDRQEVPLAEELAFLEHYLEIQKIRFGEQLGVGIEIAHEVRYASVPSLILQPLVENAIRHGISKRATGGEVRVTAEAREGKLLIRVVDDGVGLPPGWTVEKSAGLGLSVTRERIAGLYPNGTSRFAISSQEEGGTAVEIELPLVVKGEEASDSRVA